jgi:hypothetical protein
VSDDKYFQAPLSSLAFGTNEKEMLEHIISYCIVDVGLGLCRKMSGLEQRAKSKEIAKTISAGFDKLDSEHLAAAMGAQAVGCTIGSFRFTVEHWRALNNFRHAAQSKYGPDATFRLPRGLVFEARDGHGISHRELRVLAAVISCIGAKSYPVRITRKAIQCRMLGYKSPSILAAELPNRKDGALPITFRQINYTLDRLHERQFFARARANERQTFYSIRHAQDALEKALVDGKSYSAGFHQRRKDRNSKLMADIAIAKASTIKVNTPIKVDTERAESASEAEKSTNDVHSASTGVSTGVSTLIKTPLIETLLTQTPSSEATQGAGVFETAPAVWGPGEFKRRALIAIEKEQGREPKENPMNRQK